MFSRFRTDCSRSSPWGALALVTVALTLAACSKGPGKDLPSQQLGDQGVIDTALVPGLTRSAVTNDPRAAQYYDNADAVNTGARLFKQYNCSGCHSSGGGGMGPSLMDDEWIYGGRLEQIHQTLVEGRPNGMPAWGGKIPDQQLWQISTYVRSMSLPETLAADHSDTPSQSPAPVPRAANDHAGWALPPDTTNDYTTVTTGPQ